jgi:hypothetical protein
MSEDQFTKLYTYMQREFGELREQLDTKASAEQVDTLYSLTDGIAKRLDDDATEQTITNSRHEDWIKQLADNTGTKLVPEP